MKAGWRSHADYFSLLSLGSPCSEWHQFSRFLSCQPQEQIADGTQTHRRRLSQWDRCSGTYGFSCWGAGAVRSCITAAQLMVKAGFSTFEESASLSVMWTFVFPRFNVWFPSSCLHICYHVTRFRPMIVIRDNHMSKVWPHFNP